MRRPIIAGNWKLNLTARDAADLATQIKRLVESPALDVVLCPSFPLLPAVASAVAGSSISLGAQDLFWESQGAFTGEVSAPMLLDAGCRYVIIGHSERRHLLGETDEQARKKVTAACAHGLIPILCMGETLAQREQAQTFAVVQRQLERALSDWPRADAERLVIAYEPVWAIGTGKTATPAQAQEVHAFIRQRLTALWNASAAEAVRLQYGGSVSEANAAELLQQPDVDGALVGGASLKADAFGAIIQAAVATKLAVRS